MDTEDGGQVGPGWHLWAPRGANPQPERSQHPPPGVLPGAMGAVEALPPGSAAPLRFSVPSLDPRLQLTPETAVLPETQGLERVPSPPGYVEPQPPRVCHK